MAHKYAGGCDHVHCKGVTGQATTHVVFFGYKDLDVDNTAGLKRQPFNNNNPNGALELCTCASCGKPIMLDDKRGRIRAIVPNLMGYDAGKLAAAYHAFYDPETGVARPNDGRPVYEGLRPEFVWPPSA